MMTTFWKLYAEGNAYVVVDEAAAVQSLLPWVTDPVRGLGGDGLILAEWRAGGGGGMELFQLGGGGAPPGGNGAPGPGAPAGGTRRGPAGGGRAGGRPRPATR